MSSINLYHGDSLEAMKQMPDKCYDLAIVDPPYGIGMDGVRESTGSHGGRKAHHFKGWDNAPSGEYFNELKRVSKNQIIWGANYYPFHLDASMGWIFWDKGQRICNRELAYSSFERALRVVTINRVELMKDGETFHPTQKPVKLYKWLLKNYAKEGEKILDTHGGSMSIAIACHDMGFDLDLWEIDEDYYKAGVKRFENHKKQLNLFRA